jgi:hypothetical protein
MPAIATPPRDETATAPTTSFDVAPEPSCCAEPLRIYGTVTPVTVTLLNDAVATVDAVWLVTASPTYTCTGSGIVALLI